jgi:hypothetical protein
VNWKPYITLWTITSDPMEMSWSQHWKTLKHRWHIAHRTLLRLCPSFRYFLVVERTKNDFPHLHILTDSYIDWHEFQHLLMRAGFGEVLDFERREKDKAIRYATKYATKAVTDSKLQIMNGLRLWSTSIYFLPTVIMHDPDGDWILQYVDTPWSRTPTIYRQ